MFNNSYHKQSQRQATTATLENSLAFSNKDENMHAWWLWNPLLGYCPWRNSYTHAPGDMYKKFHSDIVWNIEKLKGEKQINSRMDKKLWNVPLIKYHQQWKWGTIVIHHKDSSYDHMLGQRNKT